jgi:hypothetical protein
MKNPAQKIDINVYDEGLYSSNSSGEKVLNDDLCLLIQNVATAKQFSDNTTLNFVKSEDKEIDEDEFKSAYKATIGAFIKEKKRKLWRCLLCGLLLWVGCLGLSAVVNLLAKNWDKVYQTLLKICSLIMLWTGLDKLTLEPIQILIQIKKYKKMINFSLTFSNRTPASTK